MARLTAATRLWFMALAVASVGLVASLGFTGLAPASGDWAALALFGLCAAAALAGCDRRRVRTTVADPAQTLATNLVARDFAAAVPHRLWIGDSTYLPTREGWLSLAVLVDAHARRVVGWALADHPRTERALDAFAMARCRRRPGAGLVHHTDRGSQYTAPARPSYSPTDPGQRARRRGSRSSRGAKSGPTVSVATPPWPTAAPSPMRSTCCCCRIWPLSATLSAKTRRIGPPPSTRRRGRADSPNPREPLRLRRCTARQACQWPGICIYRALC